MTDQTKTPDHQPDAAPVVQPVQQSQPSHLERPLATPDAAQWAPASSLGLAKRLVKWRGAATVKPLRIGIYAGAFDPVHAGHIAFALQALELAQLDEIVFLPERRPRAKPGVEHYAHRIAMLKKALRPHPMLSVMETVERNYSVTRTLPALQQLFKGARLVMLIGSDVALCLAQWPHAAQLLKQTELVIGIRSQHQADELLTAIRDWPLRPLDLKIIDSYAPDISSSQIRLALSADSTTKGLLSSVHRYALQEWLYVSPGNIPS